MLGKYIRIVPTLKFRARIRLVWRPVKCIVCETWQSRSAIVAGIGDKFVCEHCVEEYNGPGKYQAYQGDKIALGKVLILNACVNSSEDDLMYSEGWGYCGRFGAFLLYEDAQGFTTYGECHDEEKAEALFQRLYLEGWGASENDAYISDDRNGYSVFFDGKYLGTVSRFNRTRALIRLESAKTGYYPDAWHVNDHGNIQNVSY